MDLDYDIFPVEAEGDPPADKERISPWEAIIDTGATASAGGSSAVTQLCAAISKSQPNAQISVFQGDRPWFRYGNGKWGQAMFRVSIKIPPKEISIFALPAPNVPVLVGMRELRAMDAVLSSKLSKGIILGNCVTFRTTRKMHMLLDFRKHIFFDSHSSSRASSEKHVHFSEPMESDSLLSLNVLELAYDFTDDDDDEGNFDGYHLQHVHLDDDVHFSEMQACQHLHVTHDQWAHLSCSQNSITASSHDPQLQQCNGVEWIDERCSQEGAGGHGESSGERGPSGQIPEDCGQDHQAFTAVRYHEDSGARSTRSSIPTGHMAVPRTSHSNFQWQQVRQVDGVSKVRLPHSVHSRDLSFGGNDTHQQSHERDGGIDSTTFIGLGRGESHQPPGQVHDRHCREGEGIVDKEAHASNQGHQECIETGDGREQGHEVKDRGLHECAGQGVQTGRAEDRVGQRQGGGLPGGAERLQAEPPNKQ